MIPGPVYDALINVNKRNVTLDLMEMFKAEIEQNKKEKEEKLKDKENTLGKSMKPKGQRRPSEYRPVYRQRYQLR